MAALFVRQRHQHMAVLSGNYMRLLLELYNVGTGGESKVLVVLMRVSTHRITTTIYNDEESKARQSSGADLPISTSAKGSDVADSTLGPAIHARTWTQ